jgi:two-component system, cell cycle response regulator DivK
MRRILLIEDDDSNQDLISRYLELFECDVTVAGDGQQGLELALRGSTSFDVVLMDMNLTRIDGWEVTRRLKMNESTRLLPVIALTAHAMVGDREKALAAGCDEYETKPIDFQRLFDKINSVTGKAH